MKQPSWQEEAKKLQKAGLRHILFLCVNNSARSQMAEGIARQLAPAGVEIYSAGSHPTSVNPLAIQVLQEIGVDISRQRSKGLDVIPAEKIEVVITLCAEEICPLFLSQVMQFHWGIEDPNGPGGDYSRRLQSFRRARDLLRERLALVFSE